MTVNLIVQLPLTESQHSRLEDLQRLFSEACNSISPIVREARCWNRVALHHMVYKQLREDFPALGSQMSCNVIYSVCRAARAVYQSGAGPWSMNACHAAMLPLIRFFETAPVYFDRHTLSLRAGLLSLFTLDGRMRVSVDLQAEFIERFQSGGLREISLIKSPTGFQLSFSFSEKGAVDSFSSRPVHFIVEDPNVELLAEHRPSGVLPEQKVRAR